MFECNLPMPPSVNAAYRAVNGRVIKSRQNREWCKEAMVIIGQQHKNITPITGRVGVRYGFGFPDKRRTDIANREKILSDFLADAGVFLNDCQIDDMHLVRMDIGNGVSVKVWEIGNG